MDAHSNLRLSGDVRAFLEKAQDVLRPAMARSGKFALSLGTDGLLRFYEIDGPILLAQFDLTPDGRLAWRRNEYLTDLKGLAAQITNFHELMSGIRGKADAVFHWCGITCFREHGDLGGIDAHSQS